MYVKILNMECIQNKDVIKCNQIEIKKLGSVINFISFILVRLSENTAHTLDSQQKTIIKSIKSGKH